MSNERIDLTWFERFPQHDEQNCAIITDDTYALIWEVPRLIAELKRCYQQIDLLTKAFMMAGNHGYYMTICEECDDVHTLDDECPFICEYCCEKNCECPASE